MSRLWKYSRYVLFLSAAVMAGVISSEVWMYYRSSVMGERQRIEAWKKWSGEVETDEYTYIPFRFSKNGLEEVAVDSNGDSKLDEWRVAIRPNTPLAADFLARDKDFDGVIDSTSISLGSTGAPRARISLSGLNSEGTPKKQVFALFAPSDPNDVCRYTDLNYDGIVDMFDRIHGDGKGAWERADPSYVIMGDKMQQIHLGRSQGEEIWVTGNDGMAYEIKFTDGAWLRAQ